jgi:hypothetical protein
VGQGLGMPACYASQFLKQLMHLGHNAPLP